MTDQKDNRQRITVSIYGQPYTVVGQESPAYVKEVAKTVDQKMREIKKHNPYLDTTRLAVLTAINVVDDYFKVLEELEELKQKGERRTTGDE